MANIESNTLLEKLTQINSIKNRLRQSIVNIGGGDYINEQSPFAAFPRALNRIFSDIKNTDRLLEYIVNGGDLNEIAEKEDLTYVDILPYVNDIQTNKQTLVDNLRVKGVLASIDEPLESLVNKVLRIEGSSPEPEPSEHLILSKDFDISGHLANYAVKYYTEENNYRFEYTITNKSDTDLEEGIIIKDISEDGWTYLYNISNTITSGQYATFGIGFSDEEDALRFKERYNENMIIQGETYTNCTPQYREFDLNKLGYTGLHRVFNMRSSERLGVTVGKVSFYKDSPEIDDDYILTEGLVDCCLIDFENNNCSLSSYYSKNSHINLNDIYEFNSYGYLDNRDDSFCGLVDDFGTEISYEDALRVYNKYNQFEEIEAVVGNTAETDEFTLSIDEFNENYIKVSIQNKTSRRLIWYLQFVNSSGETSEVLSFSVNAGGSSGNTHYYGDEYYKPVSVRVRI